MVNLKYSLSFKSDNDTDLRKAYEANFIKNFKFKLNAIYIKDI